MVVKRSGFNNMGGKGADHGAGSRSLAMCYLYFLLRGKVFFERSLSEPMGELEMEVKLEKTGSQTPISFSAWKAVVSSPVSFLFQRADALPGELGRPGLHSRVLSLAAVSSSGCSVGSRPD